MKKKHQQLNEWKKDNFDAVYLAYFGVVVIIAILGFILLRINLGNNARGVRTEIQVQQDGNEGFTSLPK